MKHLLISLKTAAMAAVLTSVAQAAVWTDYHSGQPLAHLHQGNSSYTGTFNILNDGYNPGLHTLTSATAKFAFADDDVFGDLIEQEWVEIELDGDLLINSAVEVDGTHASFDWHSNGLTGSMLFTLSTLGTIDYTITILDTQWWTNNSTYLKVAKLKAYGDYKQVPDSGATVALMGLGLVGLVAARKRLE